MLDIDFTTVSAHENGRRGLTQAEIKKYAALYKVESYELFLNMPKPVPAERPKTKKFEPEDEIVPTFIE